MAVGAIDVLEGCLLVVATVGAAMRARRASAARVGWACFAVGAGLSALAQGLVIARGYLSGPGSGGVVADWLTTIGAPAIGVSLLAWPGAPSRRGPRTRMLLDGVILAGASLFVVWSLFLADLHAALARSPGAFEFTIASIAIATVFVAIAVLLLAHDPRRLRGPIGVYLACLVTSIGADLVSASAVHRGAFFEGQLVDVLQVLPTLVLAAVPLVPGALDGRPWPDDEVPSRLSTYLAYIPVAVALAVGLAKVGPDEWDRVRGTTALVVALAVLWRQGLALRDLRRLSLTLDARVAERTRELEQSQAALVRAQRLDAVGKMASSVAHDFNNLLTVIKMASDHARRPELDAAARGETLDDVDGAVERAVQLVRQLLTFARQQPAAPQRFEPAVAVRRLAPLLARLLGTQHRLDVDTGDHSLCIEADPVQFDQVLTNLVANARDAMPSAGTVTIRVSAAEPVDGVPQVCVAVRDTGTGMTPEVLERVFEPFFTTKVAGEGTGLGLATVYGIVERSKGKVNVDSAPGRGTAFVVSWPVSESPAARAVTAG